MPAFFIVIKLTHLYNCTHVNYYSSQALLCNSGCLHAASNHCTSSIHSLIRALYILGLVARSGAVLGIRDFYPGQTFQTL